MEYTDILINIRKILRSLNLESKKIQKEYGVSIPQLMCLEYLGDKEDYRSTQGSIARYLNLNSSTMSGIIDRLEIKGYVARLPNPDDKRTVYISLTSKGARLLDTSPQLLHHQLSKRLEKLPENKIREINDALIILVQSLNIEEIQASPLITLEDPISLNPEE
ncbi:MAG: MarR family transcriptional regulator [Bacteroidetes bacterium]|jgi:DNA-binding MarR family transcriptional regulator|nr:MarR family transcriptional regulator [Bacteroidota bacterium]